MSEGDQQSKDAWYELELEPAARVHVRPRATAWIGIAVVAALVGAAIVSMGRGGSSETAERIEGFRATMVDQPSFTYDLVLSVENIEPLESFEIEPGGPVEIGILEGRVAAEDRYAQVLRERERFNELIRVGDDDYTRDAPSREELAGETWEHSVHVVPEPLSLSEVREQVDMGGIEGLEVTDARLAVISGIFLARAVDEPGALLSLLADIDPEEPEDESAGSIPGSVADAFDDDVPADGVPVVGSVPFPVSYAEVLPDAPPLSVTVMLGRDGNPSLARLEVREDDAAFIVDVRFDGWGSDIEIVAPDDVIEREDGEDGFREVGTAIEEDDSAVDDLPDDGPDDGGDDVLHEPGTLDPSMALWVPTAVPDDFHFVQLEPSDVSGDDKCHGAFAIWIASSDRPAADWVSQETPDSDNSQLLTVTSVPADCQFVERTPLFQPGPFGDRPVRRNGDQWEVLIDDSWVVKIDSVVVTWEELTAMIESIDLVSVEALQAQLE